MKLNYRPEIDGLRTIAVISVILFHANLYFGSDQWFAGGFFGVDVFFVISGYLITRLIITELEKTGRFSILNFYERRIRRLLPALFFVILASIPFALKYLLPSQLIDYAKSLLASLFFSSNFYWHFALQEYGTEASSLRPFLHTWSLSVEEQFYIFFPLILIAIHRWAKRYVFIILGTCFILSFAFAQWITIQNYSLSFFMLPSRFWELTAGAILAYLHHSYPERKVASFSRWLPLLGLVLIAYSITSIPLGSGQHPGFMTLIPVMGTVFVIAFAHKNDLTTRFLSTKPMVAIGLISYSLYLWHYPIFAFGYLNIYNPNLYHKSAWILLAFVLSIISYFFAEQPFRKKNRVSRKTVFLSAAITMVSISVFAGYAIQHKGLKNRFPSMSEIYGKNEFDNKILKDASWDILATLAKENGFGKGQPRLYIDFERNYLWFSDDPKTTKILVIGDSHCKDLFNALYLNHERFPHLEFARLGMHSDLLEEQINAMMNAPNFLKADVVLMTFNYTKKTIQRLPDLIKKIQAQSKDIRITKNITILNVIEGEHIFDWYVKNKEGEFDITALRRLFFENQSGMKDAINVEVRKLARQYNLVYLDSNDFTSEQAVGIYYGVTDDGYKAFYDRGHFTVEGARFFGKRIQELGWLQVE